MKTLLDINDLKVKVEEKEILKGLNLKINEGEVHIIMGPNGAGKSTLANVILNNVMYTKTSGKITFDDTDITNLDTDKIAKKGVFMSFQTPIEIPGITTINFLKYIDGKINETNENRIALNKKVNSIVEELSMKKELLNRNLNVGFSGGEKKKNEMLQLLKINPKLAILDETDSGLDIDSLKVVSKAIKMFKNDNNSLVIISHNVNIFKDLNIDYVHILVDGQIVETSDASLISYIEENGYSKYVTNKEIKGE